MKQAVALSWALTKVYDAIDLRNRAWPMTREEKQQDREWAAHVDGECAESCAWCEAGGCNEK